MFSDPTRQAKGFKIVKKYLEPENIKVICEDGGFIYFVSTGTSTKSTIDNMLLMAEQVGLFSFLGFVIAPIVVLYIFN